MYTLRPATPADAPFLAWLELVTAPDAEAPPPATYPVRSGATEGPRAPVQRRIVLVGGQPVGVVAIERSADALVVAELRLAPAYRDRGVGTALLGELLAEARRAGLAFTLQLPKAREDGLERERLERAWGFGLAGETATHWRLTHALGRPAERADDGRRSDPPAVPPGPGGAAPPGGLTLPERGGQAALSAALHGTSLLAVLSLAAGARGRCWRGRPDAPDKESGTAARGGGRCSSPRRRCCLASRRG